MISRILYSPLLFVLLATVPPGGDAAAAADDCKALYDGIRKERVLMKKKALVEVALRSCPNNPDIVYQGGYIHERLRKYGEALAAYQRTIDLDPAYAKAYFSIGDIRATLNNYEEAVNAYRDGLRYDSGNARAESSLRDALAKIPESATPPPASAPQEKPVVPAPVEVVKKDKGKVAISEKVASSTPRHLVKPITRLAIPFAGKSTELSREAGDVLSVVVGQAMNRDDMRDSRFELRGYSENGGSADNNVDIARKRAEAVKKHLVDGSGINSQRLKLAAHGRQQTKAPKGKPGNSVVFTEIN
ncbi:MAG: OmpA family protein [Desulfurivibrionaceae bacterium]